MAVCCRSGAYEHKCSGNAEDVKPQIHGIRKPGIWFWIIAYPYPFNLFCSAGYSPGSLILLFNYSSITLQSLFNHSSITLQLLFNYSSITLKLIIGVSIPWSILCIPVLLSLSSEGGILSGPGFTFIVFISVNEFAQALSRFVPPASSMV